MVFWFVPFAVGRGVEYPVRKLMVVTGNNRHDRSPDETENRTLRLWISRPNTIQLQPNGYHTPARKSERAGRKYQN
jgi:hypothetical protein